MDLKSSLAFIVALFVCLNCSNDITTDKKELFISDFLKERKIFNYNYYGCLSRKKSFNFRKRQHKFGRTHLLNSFYGIYQNNFINHFIFDGTSCNIITYLNYLNKNNLLNSPFKHLFLILRINFDLSVHLLKQYEILLMSEITVAVPNDMEVDMYLIYKVNNQSDLVINYYGKWSMQKRSIWIQRDILLSSRRANFRKEIVRLGTVIFEDASIIHSNFDDIPPTPDSFFQQDTPILYSLLQSINATMTISVYNNHGYGRYNHTINKMEGDGMVRDLFDKKIDLASTMYLSSERIELFIPLAPIDFWAVRFFLKKPSLSYVKNIYVLTLSSSVWSATFIITILFMATIFVALKFEFNSCKKRRNRIALEQSVHISDMFLLSFEAICQQGTSLNPFKISGRFLLLLLFLMFMFIYVAYSASILVLLKSTAKINTLSNLLDSRYEVGGLNKTYVKHYFQGPKEGVLRELYVKKICSQCYFDQSTGLEKVQKGNFAFFAPMVASYKYFMKNFTNHEICTLQELPGYMNMKSYPFVRKSTGYTEIFEVRLLNIMERGISERSKTRVVRKPQCNNQAGNFQSVRIFDCLYLILIHFYGTLLSILVLIMEILAKKYLSYKR